MHESIENLIRRITRMGRGELIRELRSLDCSFPIDFSDDYLNGMSVERLRHIILAASLHIRPAQVG